MSLSSLHALWCSRMVYAANVALPVYEYFITFDKEYDYIWEWKNPISLMKVAFILNRYITLGSVATLFAYADAFDPFNAQLCRRSRMAHSVLTCTQFLIAQFLILARAYVVWGRKRVVGMICLIALAATFGVAFHFSIRFAHSGKLSPMEQLHSPGCIYSGSSSLTNNLIAIAACETFALLLLVSKAAWHYYINGRLLGRRMRDSPDILKTMINDGVAYFAVILSLTVVNMFNNIFVKNPIHPIFVGMQATAQNILVVRLVFHVADKYGDRSAPDTENTFKYANSSGTVTVAVKGSNDADHVVWMKNRMVTKEGARMYNNL